MATTFIYALNDPETGECRYIGKADKPQARFKEHLRKSLEDNPHKKNWILSLRARGLEPVVAVLREVPIACWEACERWYISQYRMCGFDLTNVLEGGETPPVLPGDKNPMFGKKHSVESREKMRRNRTGLTAGTNNPNFGGRSRKQDTREKVSKALVTFYSTHRHPMVGVKRSDDTRRKLSEQKRGANHPCFGKKICEETLLRRRAGLIFSHAVRKFMKSQNLQEVQ